MITVELLQKLFPATPKATLDDYVEPLNKLLPAHHIVGKKRVAAFLAQVGHESGGFTATEEKLGYSAARLLVVFKKYFTPAQAAQYAYKPEAIASRVYANRYLNGNEASKDGWRYRGRSLIMVTFKANYLAFAQWAGITLDEAVVYLGTPEGAVAGAVWYWDSRNLNALADGDQITNISKIVNGGKIGLAERKAIWRKALALL